MKLLKNSVIFNIYGTPKVYDRYALMCFPADNFIRYNIIKFIDSK